MSLDTQTATTEAAPETAAPEITTRDDLVGIFAAQLDAEDKGEQPAAPTPEAAAEPATGDEPVEAVEAEPSDAPLVEASAPEAIVAPFGMTAEDRAVFDKLPAEAKAFLAHQEKQRTADYTRKTQEAANIAREASAERQRLAGQLQQYDAFLSSITEARLEPPNPALRQTDPLAYEDQLAQYVTAKHNQEKATHEQARIRAQQDGIAKQQYQEFVRVEAQRLTEIMPEYADAKTGPALRKAVVNYATEQGFGEHLGKLTAVEVALLTKAMRYDQAQTAKAAAPKVVPMAPKTTKPGPARGPGQRTGITAAVENLTARPTRDNLAAAFLAQLNSER